MADGRVGGKIICINKERKSSVELIFSANQLHMAGDDLCSIALKWVCCPIVANDGVNGLIAIDSKISDNWVVLLMPQN